MPIPEVEPEGVLIRVSVANICGSDLHFWRGDAPLKYPEDGWIYGHEMTGRVARLGAKVKTDSLGRPLREGDRVAYTYFYPCRRCYACLNNEPAACPNKIERPLGPGAFPHLHGAFADHYYLRPGGHIFAVPAELSDEAVAPVNCALSQVLYGLRVAGLRFGDSVVIQGAGGLGIQAAAVAKDMGAATVIVIDQIAGRLELARAFGADHTINLKEVPDRRERVKLVRQWTGGVGADVACDLVGFPAVIPEGHRHAARGRHVPRDRHHQPGRQDRAGAVSPRVGLEEDRRRDPVRPVGDPARARFPRRAPAIGGPGTGSCRTSTRSSRSTRPSPHRSGTTRRRPRSRARRSSPDRSRQARVSCRSRGRAAVSEPHSRLVLSPHGRLGAMLYSRPQLRLLLVLATLFLAGLGVKNGSSLPRDRSMARALRP